MKHVVRCPSCQAAYRVDQTLLGKKARCKHPPCGVTFVLGETGAPSPSPAPVATPPVADDGVPVVWRPGDVILGLYDVLGVLGEGGMGTVYRVRHRGWGVDLAVKSCKGDLLHRPGAVADFEREAETWVNLGLHPHVVSCHYVRRLGGLPRVFAEFVEGGSLKDWVEDGRLYDGGADRALERTLDVAIQSAWGLHHAHEAGLVHQDVKPANVLLTPDGTAKVTDFGLANARSGELTPAYCSPEQAARAGLGRTTDVWSWAVSVLELFTGEVSWPSGTVAGEALEVYLEAGPGDDRLPAMPPAVAGLLRRCLAADAGRRPPDMLAVADELRESYARAAGRPYPREVPAAAELRADTLNNRAVSLLDLGRGSEAEAAWEEALRADHQHLEATANLGLLRWRAGRQTDVDVLRDVVAAAENQPRDAWGAYLLAQLLLERGDCDRPDLLDRAAEDPALRDDVRRLRQAFAAAGPGRVQILRDSPAEPEASEWYGQGPVSLSACGRFAAGVSSGANLRDDVRVWDARDGRLLGTLSGHSGAVSAVQVGDDGRAALSGGYDHTVRLWDVATRRCLRVLQGHENWIVGVAPLPGWGQAVSAGLEGTLRVWDLAGGACLQILPAGDEKLVGLGVSQDGRLVVAATDQTLWAWDPATGGNIWALEHPGSSITCLALKGDGRSAVTGHFDGSLRTWDLAAGGCRRELTGHPRQVHAVSLSGDGRLVASGGGDGSVRVWDAGTGRCLRTLGVDKEYVGSVGLSRDGTRLLTVAGLLHRLTLWHVQRDWPARAAFVLSRPVTSGDSGKAAASYREAVAAATAAAARGDSPAAVAHLTRARSQPGYERHPEAVGLWAGLYPRVRRRALRAAWEVPAPPGLPARAYAFGLAPAGSAALCATGGGALTLCDLATGQCRPSFDSGHALSVLCVGVSADQRRGVASSRDWPVKVYDLERGVCLHSLSGHRDAVWTVLMARSGRFVLSASSDQTLRLWDPREGHCLRVERFMGGTPVVCLGEDDRFALVGGEDGRLRVYDLASGTMCRESDLGGLAATAVAVSGDGRVAASGDRTGRVFLWDVATGRCRHECPGHVGSLAGVTAVAVSPDGRTAASGGEDHSVRLWDVATGSCVRTLQGHHDWVSHLAFTPDARHLVSLSRDGVLKFWFLDWDLEGVPAADWDEGARPHLTTFLTAHTPYAAELPAGREPTPAEVTEALTRRGRPAWGEADFQTLLDALGRAGYGWLRPAGVRRELEAMTAVWEGPPPVGS